LIARNCDDAVHDIERLATLTLRKAVSSPSSPISLDLCNWNLDLRNQRLCGLNLAGADLSGMDLSDTDLQGTNLKQAKLNEIRASSTTRLRGAQLEGVSFRNAILNDVDLQDMNLTSADLTGAHLARANLTRVNLTQATLTNADLTGANLTEAILLTGQRDGVQWQGVIVSQPFPLQLPSSTMVERNSVRRAILLPFVTLLSGVDINMMPIKSVIATAEHSHDGKEWKKISCETSPNVSKAITSQSSQTTIPLRWTAVAALLADPPQYMYELYIQEVQWLSPDPTSFIDRQSLASR
jgi:uncharacterized protein YjbI with pentapeptide repeats